MTTTQITINDPEKGDVLVEATATYYEPAIEDTRDAPGQPAYIEFDLDKDIELSQHDCDRVRDALIKAIEHPER